MKKIILFCAVIICGTLTSHAQVKIDWGGKIGGGLSEYSKLDPGSQISVNYKTFFAYKAGLATRITYDYGIFSMFFLETGLLYDKKGSKTERNMGSLAGAKIIAEVIYSAHYLTVPVHIGVNLGWIYVNTGLGLSLHLSNSKEMKSLGAGEFGPKTSVKYNAFNPSFDAGFGFNFSKKISLGLELSLGLSRVFAAESSTSKIEAFAIVFRYFY